MALWQLGDKIKSPIIIIELSMIMSVKFLFFRMSDYLL